jgi:xylulokinase
MGYMLGIDIGTSSIKVGLFSEDGQLVTINRQEYEIDYPVPGWAEVDPDSWWSLVRKALKEVLNRPDITAGEIYSVGISTLCPALLAVDHSFQVLHPAIIFIDQRSSKEAEKIKRVIPEEVFFETTGNRIIPGASSLTSIIWLKKNRPEVYRKTSFFGHGNSYIAYKLTGNFFLDRTNASYMGVFDARATYDWRRDLIEDLGLSPDKFPPVLLSSSSAGWITREASRETGLIEGTPVAIGGADTACSSLALGVLNNGDLFESCGTSDVITVCTSKPSFNDKFLNRCHVIDNHWLLHGAMSTPGAIIKWMGEELAPPREGINNVYDLIFKEATESPPGANGLIFLPYMFGERTPIWDPNARGVFFGLSLNSKRGDIYRAVLEGVGFGLRQILEIVMTSTGLNVQELKVVGGAAQNQLWNQIKADILQVELLSMEYQETAVLGAALLGGMNAGIINDIYKFTEELKLKRLDRYHPDQNNQLLYNQLYQLYIDLYPLLKDKYKQLRQVFN